MAPCLLEHRTPDPIGAALRSHHLMVTEHALFGQTQTLFSGVKVCIRRCEVIYRLPEPDLLLIVLYRRLTEQDRSLSNPFADLLWFLQLCTRPEFGVRRVMCYVSTDRYRQQNGLTNERMIRFCRNFLNAEWTEYDGGRWLYQDAETLRARLQQMRHKVTPLKLIF